jgi:signal transduction histidine kinase/CheY-like chemotaxis protein
MAVPTPTAIVAQSGIIVEVNTSWRRLTGDRAGSDVGDPLWRRFAPAERAHIVALIERLRDTPDGPADAAPTVAGTQIRDVDGRRIDVALRLASARDGGPLLVAQAEPLTGTRLAGVRRPGTGDRQLALAAIARAVSTGTDVSRIARSVIPTVARATGCALVGLWRRASWQEAFVLVDGIGFSAEARGTMMLEGHDGGLAAHTVRSRSAVVIGGPTGTAAQMPRALTDLGVSSGVAVPLYGVAGADGLLMVSATHNQPIDADDIRFLSIVGDLLTVALQRGGIDELIAGERQRTATVARDLERLQRQHGLARAVVDLRDWCWSHPTQVMTGVRDGPQQRWSVQQCLEAGPQGLVDCAVADDADDAARTINAALADHATLELTVRLRTADGIVPLRLRGGIERDESNAVRRIWGVAVADPPRPPSHDAHAPLTHTAHELNNLLAAVLGTAEQLAERGAHRRQMTAIVHAGRRARRLIAGLRPDHDVEHPLAGAYDLAEVVEQVRPLLHGLVGPNVRLAFELDRAACTSRLPREQVECILLDLVSNSADALSDAGEGERQRAGGRGSDGTVLIATDTCLWLERTPGAPPAGNWARLRVRDNGAGMTASDRDRAFAPGFTTKAGEDHGGLGLATVHTTVAAAGGVIGVDSAPDRGTTIDVYLPAAAQEAARLHPVRAALPSTTSTTGAAPHAGARVALIADDESSVRGLMCELLSRMGFHVAVAADGVGALARARELDRVDLLVSDLRMPQMDGLDLGRRVRDIHAGAAIVLLTGAPLTRRVTEHDLVILRKPFEWNDLRDAVLSVMTVQRGRPAGITVTAAGESRVASG